MKQRTDLSKRDRSSVQPMMAESVPALEEASRLHYDYSEIEEDAQKRLHSIVLEIRHHDRIASVNMIMIGKRLQEAKALIPHGGFQDWAEKEFGYKHVMVDQMMAVALRFGDKVSLSDILGPTVMRVLSSPSIADEEIAELTQKAEEEGRKVSVKEAEALRKRKREEKRRKEEEEEKSSQSAEIEITSSEYSVQRPEETTARTGREESKEFSSGADELISELPSESAPSKRLDLNAPEEIQARMRNLVNAFESIHFWPVLERMTLAEVIDAWHFAEKRKMERDPR